MTVAELARFLSKCPKDADVCLTYDTIDTVEEIKQTVLYSTDAAGFTVVLAGEEVVS